MPFVLILYSAVFYLLTPLLILRLLLRARKNPGYRKRILERFGFFDSEGYTGCIHFHLVSVGETMAALAVVQHYLQQDNPLPIVITSTTPTGSAQVHKHFGDQVLNVYLPFDLPGSMGRFFRQLKPKMTVLMETELWPNLLRHAKNNNVRVVVMNARMSAKSAVGYARVAAITRFMLERIDYIACQDEGSAGRFSVMRFDPKQLSITGNLKYDYTASHEARAQAADLRSHFAADKFIWIAGSTHKGEDEIILRAHRLLTENVPNSALMIVPRHPERFDQVFDLAQSQGWAVTRKSQGLEAADDFQVILCDTLGELQMLYGVADAAFIGGSLMDVGGHNPIEAIAMDRPVLSGPIYYNFHQVYTLLKAFGGVKICDNERILAAELEELSRSTEDLAALAQNGSDEIARHRGAKARTIAILDGQLQGVNA